MGGQDVSVKSGLAKNSSEVRLAQKGEILRQKEIWKLCFGDPDNYIDFYYANRYKEDETLLLLHDGEIVAMLTMIPVKTVDTDKRSFNTAMLYAIATHPNYQNRGFATQLMELSTPYLRANNTEHSILVPAEKRLFDFYRKQGYRDGFCLREALLTHEQIDCLEIHRSCQCTISSITPEEYNHRRNKQLKGRLYIAYGDEDITYQKKLSQLSGADIYAIDVEGVQGCAALERVDSDKVLIKEILLPEEFIYLGIKQITQLLSAKEYILRTPAYLGEQLGGSIRPFGMIRADREIDLEITPEELGYLGFAFD